MHPFDNPSLKSTGAMPTSLKHDRKPTTTLSASAEEILTNIENRKYVVLCGRNNCGKSYFLKRVRERIGVLSSYLGPQRYSNFNLLSSYAPRPNQKNEEFAQWLNQFKTTSQNIDNSPFNIQQAIAELTDKKRDQLKEIMQILMGPIWKYFIRSQITQCRNNTFRLTVIIFLSRVQVID